MHTVDIIRDNILLYQVKPEADSTHYKKIMGENELRLNFVHNDYINFKIGDKAFVYDEWFYITVLPQISKIKLPGQDYDYQMILQSTNHQLSRVQYLFLGDDNSLKEGEFSLTGRAIDFINLVVENSKRLLPYFNYTVGEVIDDGYRTMTFSTVTCLEALEKIAEEFNTEYWVDGLEIALVKKQADTGRIFRHGKQKGMYELVRQTVDNKNVVTRLYAFGSDKNLPEGYRNFSKRLKLPIQAIPNVTNLSFSVFDNGDGTQNTTFYFDVAPGTTVLTILSREIGSGTGFMNPQINPVSGARAYTTPVGNYEFQFITVKPGSINYSPPVQAIATTAQPVFPLSGEIIYLEKNIDKYGVFESTVIFEEVYPHRTGTVSSINAGDPFEFSDTGMDFNINDFLLPGATAKVTFNSGQLTGYTFDISSYDNALKKFIILKNKNERAIDVPSVDFRPAIGDKYVIVDIIMPPIYVTNAEEELRVKAQAMLDLICEPQLAYQLTFDPVYLKEKGYKLSIGDLIWIIDTSLQIEKKMRITTITRNIQQEYTYQVEIADSLSVSKLQGLVKDNADLKDKINNMGKTIQNVSILNNRSIGDFITKDGTLLIENLATAGGLTPIGIDVNGRIFRIP